MMGCPFDLTEDSGEAGRLSGAHVTEGEGRVLCSGGEKEQGLERTRGHKKWARGPQTLGNNFWLSCA